VEDAGDAGEVTLQRLLGKIGLEEPEALAGPRGGHVLLLDRPRVVVAERVEANHVVALREERFGEMRSDEACTACDEVAAHAVSALRSIVR